MHIHGNSMNIQASSFYSIANEERAAAAQRAAQVRKRLLKAAQGAASADPDADLLIGQWLDGPPGPALSGDEYSHSGRDPDFG